MATRVVWISVTGLSRGKPYDIAFKRYYKYSSPGSTKPVNGRFVKPQRYTAIIKNYNIFPMEQYDSSLGTNRRIWVLDDEYATDYYQNHRSVNNLINRALVEAGNRKMTLGETLAESPSTFRMIGSNARAIMEMFKNLKRGNVVGAARAVGMGTSGFRNVGRDASNKYLELIFGWKPLIDEVYNGVDVIRNGLDSPYANPYVVGFAKDSFTKKRPSSMTRWPNANLTVSSQYDAHCKMTFRFDHPSKGRTLDQLGLLNPVSLAWNLLPMSFVFDWFIPVGTFLDGFSATQGLKFLDGYTTQFNRHLHTGSPEAPVPGRYYLLNGVEYESITMLRRLVTSSLPAIPGFQVPDSVFQAQVAVALLLQRSR